MTNPESSGPATIGTNRLIKRLRVGIIGAICAGVLLLDAGGAHAASMSDSYSKCYSGRVEQSLPGSDGLSGGQAGVQRPQRVWHQAQLQQWNGKAWAHVLWSAQAYYDVTGYAHSSWWWKEVSNNADVKFRAFNVRRGYYYRIVPWVYADGRWNAPANAGYCTA